MLKSLNDFKLILRNVNKSNCCLIQRALSIFKWKYWRILRRLITMTESCAVSWSRMPWIRSGNSSYRKRKCIVSALFFYCYTLNEVTHGTGVTSLHLPKKEITLEKFSLITPPRSCQKTSFLLKIFVRSRLMTEIFNIIL